MVYGVGTIYANYSTSGNTNYSANSIIDSIVINKNSSLVLGISVTTPIIYGTSTNFTGSECVSPLSCSLNVTNQVFGVGTIYANYSTPGNTNYSANSAINSTVITQATPSLNLTLNGTQGNKTIYNESSIYLNGSLITGDNLAILNIYNNGTQINQGTLNISNLSSFNNVGLYNVSLIYTLTQNYSQTSLTYYVNSTLTPVTLIASTISSSESGGGGGGSTRTINKTSMFDLDKEFYEEILVIGQVGLGSIEITNRDSITNKFILSLESLDNIITLKNKEINIGAGNKSFVEFAIFTPKTPGIYTGKIIIESQGIKKEVLVIFNVKSDKSLFDVSLTTGNDFKILKKGMNVIPVQINLLQAGIKEKMDVTLNYIIKDFKGNNYSMESETIEVYGQKSFNKTISIKTLNPGDYIVGVELIYLGGVAVSSTQFKIIESSNLYNNLFLLIRVFLFLAIIVIIIILIILTRSKNVKHKTHKRKPHRKK